MSREQIVKDTAYAIWEAEGKPHGRAEEHWRQAEARVTASLATGKPKAKIAAGKAKATTPAKGDATEVSKEAAAKPPAKAAATKAAPTKTAPAKKTLVKKTAAKAKI
ncbi:DUF2934 domain-containing protein [Bosea caraganae]|nr:DUF2934 domain-containing protein [Bosea caraganae]